MPWRDPMAADTISGKLTRTPTMSPLSSLHRCRARPAAGHPVTRRPPDDRWRERRACRASRKLSAEVTGRFGPGFAAGHDART